MRRLLGSLCSYVSEYYRIAAGQRWWRAVEPDIGIYNGGNKALGLHGLRQTPHRRFYQEETLKYNILHLRERLIYA